MRISVIVPFYNEEKSIAACLTSLLKQKPLVSEIIAVDDGSTDSSEKIVSTFPVTLIQTAHRGAGAARNAGARKANGDILVFVDADMTFAPSFIQKLTAPVRAAEAIGTFTKDERVSNWDNVWARCWNYNQGLQEPYRITKDYAEEAPVFRAITKEAFMQAGGFGEDVGYTDDWTISRKLGTVAKAVSDAPCFHANPESLSEVWRQARWIGHNEFVSRDPISLVRFSLPVSLAVGVLKAVRFIEPAFFLFKLVYDSAMWVSVAESFFRKRVSR